MGVSCLALPFFVLTEGNTNEEEEAAEVPMSTPTPTPTPTLEEAVIEVEEEEAEGGTMNGAEERDMAGEREVEESTIGVGVEVGVEVGAGVEEREDEVVGLSSAL